MKKALGILWAVMLTRSRFTRLENEAATEGLLGIANEYRDGEWICLAPLGNFPHARGMQRVDADAVTRMANQFNTTLSKEGRALFGGVPFYEGHPDVPGMANEFPDRKAYGWVKALEARAEGLFGQVEWSDAGKAMLANKHYKYFSPYWDARVVGTEGGKNVYQPVTLLSVGLTNNPNLPVKPLANEKEATMEPTMKLAALVALLGLANTATEAEVTNKITQIVGEAGRVTALSNDKTTADTALANEKKAHASTMTTLANAIVQRNKFALDIAVKEGRLAPAEREAWATKLANDYTAGMAELEAKKPTLKTSPIIGAGERRTTLANAQERGAKVQELVQKEMKDSGCDYPTAFQRVRLANAALFDAMHDSLKSE